MPLVGVMAVSVGGGFGALEITNTKFEVVPPPGAGFVTVTLAFPAVAISVARMVAVNCVALTNVVALAFELKFTTEVGTKPAPFTVSVKEVPPAATVEGLKEAIVGAGLLVVKVCALDVPPPGAGFFTVTFTVPAVVMSPAGIVATICVLLIDVGVIAGFVPKFTVAPLTKPVPVRVNVKAAPPAVPLVGAIEVSAGPGLLIVKVCALDVPPPGAGFVTVTFSVPAVVMSPAGIVATICVLLMDAGVIAGFVPKFTLAPLTKPVPVRVNAKAAPPAVPLVGAIDEIVGGGLVTAKLTATEVPPPGAGFVTVTGTFPTAVRSDASIGAVIWLEFTNVVAFVTPLKLTVEPFTKPLPFTVSVNPPLLTTALEGESVVTEGAGLLTVKLSAAEVPPPGVGLVTVTLSGPAATS